MLKTCNYLIWPFLHHSKKSIISTKRLKLTACCNICLKSSQTSLTRFKAESGADTRERNLFLRQRFSHARQHIHRTIVLHTLRKRKSGFTELLRRAEGGLYRQRKGKNPLLILFLADKQPFNFFNPLQMKQFEKNSMKFLSKNADEHWFFTLFSDPIKLLIISTVFLKWHKLKTKVIYNSVSHRNEFVCWISK